METGTYDESEFHWADCRDYCRGVDQCHPSFARDYIEWKLKIVRIFDWDLDEEASVKRTSAHTEDPPKTDKERRSKVIQPMKSLQSASTKKSVLPKKTHKRNWKDAQAYCKAKGGRLPSREEMVQQLLLLPSQKRTGEKYWAQGPLYPDGSPPVVAMTADSFAVVPASPQALHAVCCF
jgi:hypothetical protein